MPKNEERVSEGAPGEQDTTSVFDFLYNDSRRVGSYLAQLDENGLLTEIRRGDQASKDARRGFAVTGSVMGTGAGLDISPKEGGSESSERVYDPFWANARELLDAVDARGMINRNVSTASLGSLVIVSGQLNVLDLSLVKALWELPGIRNLISKGSASSLDIDPQPALSRHARRSQAKRAPPAEQQSPMGTQTELMLEMLPVLPHSLNVIISGQEGASWTSLKEEYLVGSGSDLVLKHGIIIPGEWHMLGILDAQPDLGGQADIKANNAINFSDPARLQSHNLVGQFAGIISPILRVMLGRPGTHFGITPLLIFRQVGAVGS